MNKIVMKKEYNGELNFRSNVYSNTLHFFRCLIDLNGEKDFSLLGKKKKKIGIS